MANSDKFFVPSEILRVFRDLYPEVNIGNVEWSWEVPGKIYEADFSYEDRDFEVEITVTGHYLLTEISLKVEELPEVIKNAVAEKYPEFNIEEAERIEYSNGDIHYEIDLEAEGKRSFEAHFREDGMFVLKGKDL